MRNGLEPRPTSTSRRGRTAPTGASARESCCRRSRRPRSSGWPGYHRYRGARFARREHPFLVPEWPREVAAVGAEDRGPAAPDQLRPVGERHVVGVARGALEDAGRDHEAAGLAGDVLDRLVPLLAVVGGRGEVELDPG